MNCPLHDEFADREPTIEDYQEHCKWLHEIFNETQARLDQLSIDFKMICQRQYKEIQEIEARGINFGRSLYANELDKVIKENIELKKRLGEWANLEDRKAVKLEETNERTNQRND